jgi:hypothetical protein
MKAGPKASVDPSRLPCRPRSTGAARFAAFSKKFIRVPKGTGALSPFGHNAPPPPAGRPQDLPAMPIPANDPAKHFRSSSGV